MPGEVIYKHGWRKCSEEMPPFGVTVLAFAPKAGKGGRRIRATLYGTRQLEASDDYETGDVDYDDNSGEAWAWPGWYEDSFYSEMYWRVDDEVTHWQPLPKAPNED